MTQSSKAFSLRGTKATAKVDYLGEGSTKIGTAIFGSRTSLVSAADDAGATTLRIETSPIIEMSGRLEKGLKRAGFEQRANGTMWWEGTVK